MAAPVGLRRNSWLAGVGAALVFALVTLAYGWELFNDLEWRLYDSRLIAARPAPGDEVVIAGKDDEFLAAAGGEWNRAAYAEALRGLAACRPRAVGLDITLEKPSPADKKNNPDPDLTLAIKALPAVQAMRTEERALIWPYPTFEAAARRLGLINMQPESDGVVRYDWGRVKASPEPVDSLALALAKIGEPGREFSGKRFLIRYRAAAGELPRLSLAKFLEETPPCAVVKDKYILVGSLRWIENDYKPTPMARLHGKAVGQEISSGAEVHGAERQCFGVEIHAQALLTLLHDDAPVRPPPWLQILLSLAPLAALLFVHRRLQRRPVRNLLVQGALLAAWLALLLLIGQGFACFFDLLYPAIALGSVCATLTANAMATEARRKKDLEQLFGRFVAPQVAKLLLARGDGVPVGGHRKTITVMFSDVRGFTGLSESQPAEVIAALLNDYFTAMIEELFKEEGTFDKFIGDALMAFWNDPLDQPDHALRAVRAAQRMQARLRTLNADFARAGRPTLAIGIGLHTGEAIVGNQGSRIQFAYTALGDTVNTASRLMGKALPGEIVVSAATAAAIPGFDQEFPQAKPTRFELKGKAEPVAAMVIATE